MEQFKLPTNTRGAEVIEQSINLNANYTLISQTALQRLFNSTPNGALTLRAGTTYMFESYFDLSAMSATSGTFSFGFLGNASFNSLKYNAIAFKLASPSAPHTPNHLISSVATATALVVASTQTSGYARISGILRCNAGGTLIPAVGLSIASAAVVGINSYFRIMAIGSNTQTSNGNWS